jgi:molybdopterin synthase sulfur carrier subunit
MIRVKVKLFATLRKHLPPDATEGTVVVEVREGATVTEVMERLGIPAEHTKMIVSGDRHLEPGSLVADGQQVDLYPPLAGGV